MYTHPLIYHLLLQVFSFMENTHLCLFFTSEHFHLTAYCHDPGENFIVSYSSIHTLTVGSKVGGVLAY